jgi:hypothetical protein
MTESDRLGQVLVQTQSTGRAAGDLGDLERVRETRPEMIALVGDEDLRLVFESPERVRVDDPIPVMGILGAAVSREGRDRTSRPDRSAALGRVDREPLLFQPLEVLLGEGMGRRRHE